MAYNLDPKRAWPKAFRPTLIQLVREYPSHLRGYQGGDWPAWADAVLNED